MSELVRSTYPQITTGTAPPPEPDPEEPPLTTEVGLPNFTTLDNWDGVTDGNYRPLMTNAGWAGAVTGDSSLRSPGPNTYGVSTDGRLWEIFPDRNPSNVANDPEEFTVPGVPASSRMGLYGPGLTHPVATTFQIPSHPNPTYDKVVVNLWYGWSPSGPPDHNVLMPNGSPYWPGKNMDPHCINGVRSEFKGAKDRFGNSIPFATPGRTVCYGMGIYLSPDFPVMADDDDHLTFYQEHGPVTASNPNGSQPTFNITLRNTNKLEFQCRLNQPNSQGRWDVVSNRKGADPVPFVREQWMILVWEINWTTGNNGFVRAWRMDGSQANFRFIEFTGNSLTNFQTLNSSGSDARKNGMYLSDNAKSHYKIAMTNVVMGTGLKPVIQELLGRPAVKV